MRGSNLTGTALGCVALSLAVALMAALVFLTHGGGTSPPAVISFHVEPGAGGDGAGNHSNEPDDPGKGYSACFLSITFLIMVRPLLPI